MRLSMTADLSKGNAQLDALRDRIRTVAVPRALNQLRDQAETAGLRAITDEYQISQGIMRQQIRETIASNENPKASIIAFGPGFPLMAFRPVQSAAGVTVTIKGKRVLVPHAFMATMKTGRTGVFARGSYGGKSRKFKATGAVFGRFQFSSLRLSINELYTFSPPDALSNERVTGAMQDKVDAQAAVVLRREIAAVGRGF
jgi:hypothetical protein